MRIGARLTSLRGKPRIKATFGAYVSLSRNTQIVPADDSEEVDRQEIAEFLAKKGSIELLIAVSDKGIQYSELEDMLNVSNSTVYLRIEQAVEIGLIEHDRRPSEDGLQEVYTLTPTGKTVRYEISNLNLDQVFWKLQARQDQFDELSEAVRNWVADEESDFMEKCMNWWYVEDEDESPYVGDRHE